MFFSFDRIRDAAAHLNSIIPQDFRTHGLNCQLFYKKEQRISSSLKFPIEATPLPVSFFVVFYLYTSMVAV